MKIALKRLIGIITIGLYVVCAGAVPPDLDENLVIITEPKTRGHGFILQATDKHYIITTQRVLFGKDKLQFKTTSGSVLKPLKVELAEDRDIARLLLSNNGGFKADAKCKMHDPISIPVISEEPISGQIIGMGADRFEVSAEFSNSHSGSPVLNSRGEVIGVASYVFSLDENAVDNGTKWQALPRRIAYRLDGIKWLSVNWRSYNKEYGEILDNMDQFRNELFKILNSWFDSPRYISSKGINDLNLKKWVERYNAKMRYTIMSKNDRTNIDEFAIELSRICSDKVRTAKMIAEHKKPSTYIRSHFEAIAHELNLCSNYVLRIGSLEASQN